MINQQTKRKLMKMKPPQKLNRSCFSAREPKLALAVLTGCLTFGLPTWADTVTDWNANTDQAIETAAQGAPVQGRILAIVHTAIYDAVNGIDRKYTSYFVTERGPNDASDDAAAAQAAYTALVGLFPAQKATFDAELAVSLAKIPSNHGQDKRIAHGLAWGEYVANQILVWRSTDGFSTPPPPYFGGTSPGVWRSQPSGTNADGTLPALFPQNAVLVPFAMTSHDQFRPGPPPALTSALYAADLNEVEAIGRFDSTIRTPEQTQLALLWQAVGPVDENRAIRPLISPCASLVDNARLFALINIVAADATIAGFDSKYTYNLWRPYHAIRLADTDGNPDTVADPAWNSLFAAPRFQEYMSNHAVITTAFMNTLAELLGDKNTFTLSAPGYPSYTWTFDRFSDAAAQVIEARIWAGIHFRNSCNVGAKQGMKLSHYVLHNFLLPLDDEHHHGNDGGHDFHQEVNGGDINNNQE
jgi:hypothetical protein